MLQADGQLTVIKCQFNTLEVPFIYSVCGSAGPAGHKAKQQANKAKSQVLTIFHDFLAKKNEHSLMKD
jgi:hypothetical protein